MRTTIRKSVWDYMATLPDWLEVTIWITLLLIVVAFIGLAIAIAVHYIRNKKKPVKRNEHQIMKEGRRDSDKNFMKIMSETKSPWAVLLYCIKEEKAVLIAIILGILLTFNVSWNIKDGFTFKPSIKAEDVKGIKK